MNTEVRGKFLVENLDNMIENDPTFFLGFDVIVYTNILERYVRVVITISPFT